MDNEERIDRRTIKKRKKPCFFCTEREAVIDYKDVGRLRRFISDKAKILPRRVTGTCSGHQKILTAAIKRARYLAFLPYTCD